MKITYIENVRFPSERAHALQIFHTCQQLVELGEDITLVTPRREGRQDISHIFPEAKMRFQHILLPCIDALAWSWIPRSLAYLLQRWTFVESCMAWKKGRRSEIWYTRDPYILDRLAREDERWILELHTTLRESLWRRISSRVQHIVVISQSLKQWFMERGVDKDRIVVAPDGYAPEAFAHVPSREGVRKELGWKKDEVIFIYTGGLFPWKGVDRIVSWWPSEDGQSRLIIVGGSEEERKRIRALSSSSRIEILPPVPAWQVPRLLMAADVGVLPTHPGYDIGRLHTSPLKLFEYLAAGLPVLASDVPTSREVVDEQLAQFFSDQPSFLRALKSLKEGFLSDEISERAKQLAQNYTWQQRAEKIRTLLHRVST